jgi:hypothetical protein
MVLRVLRAFRTDCNIAWVLVLCIGHDLLSDREGRRSKAGAGGVKQPSEEPEELDGVLFCSFQYM